MDLAPWPTRFLRALALARLSTVLIILVARTWWLWLVQVAAASIAVISAFMWWREARG